ncbi:MAG: polysaccharide pyruvyl transferase family protein [Lachnospiraceae bacterium]|nr:polysaccharide pyruvyl transferase family protein [Lachnospiraceae bacterium]
MSDKKLKVTIITIYDPMPNIGNRLQNYAVQKIMEDLGVQVDTISFEKPIITGKQKIKEIAQRLTGYRLPGDKVYWNLFPKRIRSFELFNREYIHTQRIRKIEQIKPADYYVIGSDQVWNPKWYTDNMLKKDIFLLRFAKPEQKVCFSPSFSVEKLPNEWEHWFKENLSSFPMLGVREEAGAKIIKELTGKDAVVTIDPTLMLDQEEWNKIATKPKNVDCSRSYILTYFIGGRSERINMDLRKYARELNAVVYNLFDMSQSCLYTTGPSDFLYLISNAKLVVTDSFHACVFSFIYGKPFLLYKRVGGQNMMSRMDTLFQKFDLERKFVDSRLENDLLECNYQQGYEVLIEERKKALQFLKDSMHIE